MRQFSGELLRHHREVAGLRREAVAAAIGRCTFTVAKYEAGATTPTAGVLPQLADVLAVAVDDLFTENREVIEA